MSQMRITKQRRTARVGRRGQAEPEFSLDLRDPDIVRVKQLRRLARGTISGRTTPAS